MSNFEDVRIFMKTYGQEVKTKPMIPKESVVQLRYKLIKEELDELQKAIEEKNLLEVADALTDILYVTYGAGHAFGIDLDKCFAEVQQTNGEINGFVCSSGTGGTIAGVSKALKEKNKDIKIILSDPKGSALYQYIKSNELIIEGSSITEGIGSSRVTANFNEAIIDDSYSVHDADALNILYSLIENEGLCLGISSGINIMGAIKLGKELGPGNTIVTILCDKSDRYHSKLFNKKFLKEKNLPIPHWLQ